MRQHVLALIEHHQILAFWQPRPSRAWSVREAEEVHIPPVKSAISYATALHEIGHLLGRHESSPSVMVRERWAWRWARKHTLVWTLWMERNCQESLAWYAPRARSIDSRQARERLEFERQNTANHVAMLKADVERLETQLAAAEARADKAIAAFASLADRLDALAEARRP